MRSIPNSDPPSKKGVALSIIRIFRISYSLSPASTDEAFLLVLICFQASSVFPLSTPLKPSFFGSGHSVKSPPRLRKIFDKIDFSEKILSLKHISHLYIFLPTDY
jgi:hypothetical protein